MDITFYAIVAKNPRQHTRGRRHYCLRSTRIERVNLVSPQDAYLWAADNALSDEVAVRVNHNPVSPLPSYHTDKRVLSILTYAHKGKPGYVQDTHTNSDAVYYLPNTEAIGIAALRPVAYNTGSVVEYDGNYYVVDNSNLVPMARR